MIVCATFKSDLEFIIFGFLLTDIPVWGVRPDPGVTGFSDTRERVPRLIEERRGVVLVCTFAGVCVGVVLILTGDILPVLTPVLTPVFTLVLTLVLTGDISSFP